MTNNGGRGSNKSNSSATRNVGPVSASPVPCLTPCVAGDLPVPNIEPVVAIARHCWRGVHWETAGGSPKPVREPLKKKHLHGHVTGEGPRIGVAPIVPGESTARIAVL